MGHAIVRVCSKIEKWTSWPGKAAGWLILALVLVVCLSVIAAYLRISVFVQFDSALPLIGRTLSASTLADMQWHLFAVLVMLGGAFALRDNRHVQVDFISARFSPRMSRLVTLTGDLLLLLPFCGFMIWFGWRFAMTAYVQGEGSAYVTEVVVPAHSKLIGRTPGQFMQLRSFQRPSPRRDRNLSLRRRIGRSPSAGQEKTVTHIELLEIVRNERLIVAEEAGELPLAEGDRLLVSGGANEITAFLKETQTVLATVLADDKQVPLSSLQQTVVEAVVLPDSPFSGRVMGELGLRRRFGVDVMGVQRQGRHQSEGLRGLSLRDGDVLLLRGAAHDLRQLRESARLLLVEGVEESIIRSNKNRQALVIMLGVVLLASLTEMPIAVLALGGAVLMILTRCLRPEEALRSLDPPTLLLLAGTIPLGIAIQSTGLAALVVDRLLGVLGHADPWIFISIIYLFTSIITELLSNNAVAVLLTPIALQLALTLGIDPKPLLMAVAFGASASFMTPIGYQTNAIVMGPGGYLFKDYLKIGTPLNLLLWIVATICIPIIWPL